MTDPTNCSHATETVNIGRKPKTFCTRLAAWTNCMEVGHCIADRWRSGQLSLFT